MNIAAALLAAVSLSIAAPPPLASPYAGEEARDIKSLSAADVDELTAGRGWGLAKAAELNGVPGPRHVLDARGELALTNEQAARVEAIYDVMLADAKPLGERYVALERRLNVGFRSGELDEPSLKGRLEDIESVRAQLRFVHLVAHVKTARELSAEQIAGYNEVRGYGSLSLDICADVPEGHDAAMWRAHNNCDDD